MKKLILILFCILIILTGCQSKTNSEVMEASIEVTDSNILEQESQQTPSIMPEATPYEERVDGYISDAYDDLFEKGILPKTDIVYDTGYPLKDLSIDDLLQYVLGSDGAFAEGASDELHNRFMEQPKLVVERISVLDSSSVSVLLSVLSSHSAAYPEEDRPQFENTIYGMMENEENADISPVLEEMIKLYEYYKEMNDNS